MEKLIGLWVKLKEIVMTDKEASERIQKHKDMINNTFPNSLMTIENTEALDMAIKALERQYKERWISVSEGLPSSDGRFEVTVKGCKGKRRVDMCNFYKSADNGCGKWGDAWNGVNVIAWRERGKPHKD